MNLVWCTIALALAGADDPQPGKPDPLSAPRTLGIKVSQPPNIRVVEGSGANDSHTAGGAKVDDKAETASFEPEKRERTKGDPAQATRKTWTFSITIGSNKPVQINATVSRDD